MTNIFDQSESSGAGINTAPTAPTEFSVKIAKQVAKHKKMLAKCTTLVHAQLTIEELTEKANAQKSEINGCQTKEAIHAFRAGQTLAAIQKKLKTNSGWCGWQKDNNWNRGTAGRYIALYKGAKSEATLTGLTITEAENKFCKKVQKKKTAKPTQAPKPQDDTALAPQSPAADARDHVALAITFLAQFRNGSRERLHKGELKEAKELAEKLLAIIAELESADDFDAAGEVQGVSRGHDCGAEDGASPRNGCDEAEAK